MRSGFTAPGDYIYFKSQVPLHKIPIGTKHWRYYDFGPKAVPPLVCLPGTAGTADVYYKQIMALSMKGYRVISVDIPRVWNHVDWIQAFEKFLDAIDVHHIHIYGTSLGGFLAQLYAQHRPRRVKSLVLSNTFLDTRSFSAAMPWAPIVSWAPSFLLKRYVLTGIRDGPHEPFIADSVDFVVSQVETLSKDDLASRLSLTVDNALVGPLLLSDAFITIMDTNDYCAVPQECKDEVGDRYPEARRAYLKTGGDFPFLSRPDEVNLHLQLHLRRVGVEARPDMVAGVAKNSSSGNSAEQDKREHIDKSPPKDDEGSSSGDPSKREEQEDNDDLPEENNEEDGHLPEKDHSNDEDDDSGVGGSKNSEGPSKSNDQNEPEDSNKEDHGSSEGPSDGEEMNKNHKNLSRGGNDVHSEDCSKNKGKENGEHYQPRDDEHRSIPLDEIVSAYMALKLKKYIFEHASLHMLRDLEKIHAAMMFCEFARVYYLHLLYIGAWHIRCCKSGQLV